MYPLVVALLASDSDTAHILSGTDAEIKQRSTCCTEHHRSATVLVGFFKTIRQTKLHIQSASHDEEHRLPCVHGVCARRRR